MSPVGELDVHSADMDMREPGPAVRTDDAPRHDPAGAAALVPPSHAEDPTARLLEDAPTDRQVARRRQILVAATVLGLLGFALAAWGLQRGEDPSAFLKRFVGPPGSAVLLAPMEADGCRTAVQGEVCYGNVVGAMAEILLEPEWYPELAPDSSFEAFQEVSSTLVLGVADEFKQDAVRGIVNWLAKDQGVAVDPGKVHYFDGHNVARFAGSGFNARQVACSGRALADSAGGCGATAAEVVEERGVQACYGPIVPPEPGAAAEGARAAAEAPPPRA